MKAKLQLYKGGELKETKTCKSKAEAEKLGKKYLSGFTANEKFSKSIKYYVSKA